MKIKRKYFVVLPLAGILLMVFPGCTKDEDSQGQGKESSNSLVYEDRSLLEEVSPHFYDNHIHRIELLGANPERTQVLKVALDEGLDRDFLMIESVQKFFFNHSEVIMYSIPTLDPEQTMIIYAARGLYQAGMAHYRPADKGRMSFTLKTMDDRDYFSLSLDEQMRMGELRVQENQEIKSFNQAVYSLTYREESQEASPKGVRAICCRRESSWSACMNCTFNDCADSWICKAAGIIAPTELVAAFAVSCIGAGPDARC
jgi:hypothetical protein